MPDNHYIALPVEGGGGGTSSPLTTKGDLWGYSTANARIPVGTNGYALVADSTQTLGLKWAAVGTVTTVNTDSTTSAILTNTANVIGTTTVTLALKTQTANAFLAGPTTGAAAAPAFRAIVAADIPDLSAVYSPVAGNASLVTVGTVGTGTWNATAIALGKGGTGQTTKAAAFDALSPMNASGDVIYGGTAGTGTALAKGANGTVLKLVAGLPAWAAALVNGDVHWVNTGAGHGSTGTKVKCFTTVVQAVTTNGAISYTSDATNGDKWTINVAGIYALFQVQEPTSSTAATFGFSLNASSLTTNLISLTATEQLGVSATQPLIEGVCVVVFKAAVNDIVRCHDNGVAYSTGVARNQFHIRQLA